MLAHVRNGQIVTTYPTAEGWVALENGKKASPPVSGYVNGNDKVLPVEDETVDNATSSVTTSTIEWIVESNRVIRRTTISDKAQTSADVNAERDRRIMLPKTVTLPQAGTITVDMQNGGRENIGDLGSAAIAKTLASNNTTISFRDSSNVDHDLTNADLIAMGLQIMSQVSALHIKARAIKALSPIPVDFRDDSYWT